MSTAVSTAVGTAVSPAAGGFASGSASPATGRRWAAEVSLLAWPATLLVLGSLALARSWASPLAALVLALAAVLPLLLVRGAVTLGVSRWATAGGAVLLLLLGGYLVTAEAGLGLTQVATDVVPRLLTSPRPYAARGDLLAGPVLLTALAAVLCGLRVESPQRVLPVVAALGLYVAGMLLSAGRADPWGLMAVLLLLVALAGWIFLDVHDEPRLRRTRVAVPIALLGVVAVACGALLPSGDAFDPTELAEAPLEDVVATSPLAEVSGWNAAGSEPLLRVAGDEVPLRLAVLDVYDGRQWTAAPRFAALGSRPEQTLPDGGTTRQATTTVQVERLGTGFLPVPGRPSAIEVTAPEDVSGDLLVDVDSGAVFDAAPDGGPASTDGLRYTVTGVTDAPDDAAIQAASIPDGPAAAPYLRLPPLPEDLVLYAARVAGTASTPYQQAIAIQEELRAAGTLSSEAISGSAIYRLQSFLLGTPGEPGARVGTSEQFASAYAVLARANGLPTRVVVGFRPGTAVDGSTTRTIVGSDALAWPEVYFEGIGWVPFSPTPDDSTFVRQPPPQVDVPPATDPVEPSTGSGTTPPDLPPLDPPTAAPDDADGGLTGVGWATLGGVLLVVLVVGLMVGLMVARAVRRARHRRLGARGDWAEVLDALHVSPLRPPAHASAEQVAAGLGGGAVALAERADRAAWAPPGPGVGPGDPAALRALRREVRRSVPVWRRWWWSLDPRVFRR